MRGGTHRCGQQNGPTEVDPMVDNWDGWISASIKVKPRLGTDGIPEEENREFADVHGLGRSYWVCSGKNFKRNLGLTVCGKRNRKG